MRLTAKCQTSKHVWDPTSRSPNMSHKSRLSECIKAQLSQSLGHRVNDSKHFCLPLPSILTKETCADGNRAGSTNRIYIKHKKHARDPDPINKYLRVNDFQFSLLLLMDAKHILTVTAFKLSKMKSRLSTNWNVIFRFDI